MTTTTSDSRAMIEVIPVVVDGSNNVITKGVATLLSLEEFGERLASVGALPQAAVQDPAAAADVAALKTQFDALLAKLKAAGLMASA